MPNIKQPNNQRKTSEENQQVPPWGKKAYFALYVKSPKGAYLNTLENCRIALENDDKLKGKFAFDEALHDHVILTSSGYEALTDEKIRAVWDYIMTFCGLKTIGKDVIHEGMMRTAEKYKFNPIKEYFDSLKWDGIPRVDDWLITYFGAENNSYNKLIGKLFMLSIAARGIKPGVQQDHMLVLEGPQGLGKSNACKALGGKWFSDHMPDPTSKDASLAYRGLLIMEVPEMQAFASTRVDASLLKSTISRCTERVRFPYDRRISTFNRICIFIGTTNETDYIKDFTGARRFWPCRCTQIDVAALRADRDQLFAEAVQRKRDGEDHHPTAEEMELILRPEQDERVEWDEWQDVIEDHLNSTITSKDGIKVEDLYYASAIGRGKVFDHRDGLRLIRILKKLGWVNKRIWTGSGGRHKRRWVHHKNPYHFKARDT